MSTRNERLRENQEAFRHANERLEGVVDGKGDAEALIPFLCECADAACLDTVQASHAEFDVVHADDLRFFILPGHPRMDGEEVVDRTARYLIVEKPRSD